MEIETFFLVFLLFKKVREEGTLNRGGRSFEIMANGVGAYLGEDARLEVALKLIPKNGKALENQVPFCRLT